MVEGDILSGRQNFKGLFEGSDLTSVFCPHKDRRTSMCVCVCVFMQVLQLKTWSKLTVKMINEGISGGKQ